MIENVQEVWELLKASGPLMDQLRVREVMNIEYASGRILLGLDIQGHRHLLIPVTQNTRIIADRHSSGVQIVAHPLVDDGVLRTFVDLVCLKPHLQEIFSVLVNEVLEVLKNNPSRPDQICHQVLQRWRELLDREPAERVGIEKLIGVFGELWFLREVVRKNHNAVHYWLGPKGSRHDFAFGTNSVEVKTTLSRHGRFVEIHGHGQLEAPENGYLHLVVLKLEQSPISGETLQELVESIVLLGGDRYTLLNLLARVDTSLLALDAYKDMSFRIHESRFYAVEDGFPRITSKSFTKSILPQGVIKINYQIDLSTEPPTPLAEDAIEELYIKLDTAMKTL